MFSSFDYGDFDGLSLRFQADPYCACHNYSTRQSIFRLIAPKCCAFALALLAQRIYHYCYASSILCLLVILFGPSTTGYDLGLSQSLDRLARRRVHRTRLLAAGMQS